MLAIRVTIVAPGPRKGPHGKGYRIASHEIAACRRGETPLCTGEDGLARATRTLRRDIAAHTPETEPIRSGKESVGPKTGAHGTGMVAHSSGMVAHSHVTEAHRGKTESRREFGTSCMLLHE